MNLDAINSTSTSAITPFLQKKTIFITGATGFMGKCLLEKLFRSCPGICNCVLMYWIYQLFSFFNLDIDRIYILVRHKRGSTPIERVAQLCSSPV